VGCIFFEMLVGSCPFKGTNEGDLLRNIKSKELIIPKHISKYSVDVVSKLLERLPSKRASVDQLRTTSGQLLRYVSLPPDEAAARLPSKARPTNSALGDNAQDEQEPVQSRLAPGPAGFRPTASTMTPPVDLLPNSSTKAKKLAFSSESSKLPVMDIGKAITYILSPSGPDQDVLGTSPASHALSGPRARSGRGSPQHTPSSRSVSLDAGTSPGLRSLEEPVRSPLLFCGPQQVASSPVSLSLPRKEACAEGVAFEDGFVIVASSLPRQDETRMEQSALAFIGGLAQKRPIVCKIVLEIACLGDDFVRKASGHRESSSRLPRSSKPGAPVEALVAASTLYLHALPILMSLLGPVEDSLRGGSRQAAPLEPLREELRGLFDQLLRRAEQCGEAIQAAFALDAAAGQRRFAVPSAESVLLDAAIAREADGGFQEYLGNFAVASRLYASAKELLDALLVTVSEAEEQRQLQSYSGGLQGRLDACRERARAL